MGRLSEIIRKKRCPGASAVIVAGGSGARFGGDKLMAELGGMPVLVRTLLAFEQAELITEIVVAARPDAVSAVIELCRRYRVSKVVNVVPGGETRLQSSLDGLLATDPNNAVAAIHDGARPLVTERIIEDAVWAAYKYTAAVPAIPVRDTMRLAAENVAYQTPDRAALYAMQTPQCFQRDVILAALMDAAQNDPNITDDAAAVERLGGKLRLTPGSEENIKITTPLDLELAELILKRRGGQ